MKEFSPPLLENPNSMFGFARSQKFYTGYTVGDEYLDVYAFINPGAAEEWFINLETDDDADIRYDYGDFSSTSGGTGALVEDILRFETDSQVPFDLCWHVYSSQDTQFNWYKELVKACREWKPTIAKDATKLVYDSLLRVHPCGVRYEDIEGFLDFYGLPHFYSVLEPTPHGEDPLVAEDDPDPLVAEDAPVFELWTLPVFGKRVTDGVSFTVSVEVKDFHLLPQEILFLVCERRRALAKGDRRRASGLLNQINATQDYEIVNIENAEFLTKKYQIRLRGIRAPEIGTPNGTMARDELAKMLNGKCLTISVYYLDDLKRCVGDVYNHDNFLQEILLKKKVASFCWEKDHDMKKNSNEGKKDDVRKKNQWEKDDDMKKKNSNQ